MCQMHHLGNRKRMGQRLGQAQRLVLRWVRCAPVLQSTTAREQRTESRAAPALDPYMNCYVGSKHAAVKV